MLRRALKFAKWPPLITTILIALAAISLWYGVNRIPGLDQSAKDIVRYAGLTVLSLVWAGMMIRSAFLGIRRRLADRNKSSSDPMEAIQHANQEKVESAFSISQRLPRPSGGRSRATHLLIGPTGAGKSSLLSRSGLPADHLNDMRAVFSSNSATKQLDCVLVQDAVFIDTSGAFCDAPEQRETWLALLRSLRTAAGVACVESILVVVPSRALMDVNGHELERLARQLSLQLDDVEREVGGVPAIRIVVSQADHIPGLCNILGAQGHGEVAPDLPLSATVPPVVGEGARELTERALDRLRRRLTESAEAHIVLHSNHSDLGGVLLLRRSIEELFGNLARFVQAMVPPEGGRAERWRSSTDIWLTSAPTELSQPVEVPGNLKRLGVASAAFLGGAAAARSFGVAALFRDLPMFRTTGPRLTREEQARQHRRGLNGLLASVALSLAAGLWIFVFVLLNDTFQDELRALAQLSAAAPAPSMSAERLAPLALLAATSAPKAYFTLTEASEALDISAASLDRTRPARWHGPWLGDSQDTLSAPSASLVLSRTESLLMDDLEASLTHGLVELAKEVRPGTDPAELPCEWKARARRLLRAERLWRGRYDEPPRTENETLSPASAMLRSELVIELLALQALTSTSSERALTVARPLLEAWVNAPDPTRATSPGFLALHEAAQDVIDLLGAHGISSMILELVEPHLGARDALELRSGLFTTSTLAWPQGYTDAECREVSLRLREAGERRRLEPPQGSEACVMEDLTPIEISDARALYETHHKDAWLRHLRRALVVDADTLSAASTADLGEWIKLAFEPGTGDLDALLSSLGRGPAPRALPEEADEALRSDASWCACMGARFGLAHDLAEPEGQLRADFVQALDAQVALGEAIVMGTKDEAWWAELGRSTFDAKAELFEANSAGNLLKSTLKVRPAARELDCDLGRVELPVDELMRDAMFTPQAVVWEKSMVALRAEVERAWREQVLRAWHRVKPGLPLSAFGGRNADVSELQDLVGDGGTLDGFFAEHLEPLLTPANEVKKPLGADVPPLALTTGAAELLQERAEQRQLVAALEETFSVSLRAMDHTDVTLSYIEVDGEIVAQWDSGETPRPVSVDLVFPGNMLVVGKKGSLRNEKCISRSFTGPWALLRLLYEGAERCGGQTDDGYLRLCFTGCEQFEWHYKETGRGPLTVARDLRGIDMPSQLFVP